MSLNAKQAEFTRCLGRLLVWCEDNNIHVIGAELYRTPAQARLYASEGRGIVNSVHTKKLAIDLFIYKDGTVSWEMDDYAAIGAYWKSLNEVARWGGDFKNRDAVHFSFLHQGVC